MLLPSNTVYRYARASVHHFTDTQTHFYLLYQSKMNETNKHKEQKR